MTEHFRYGHCLDQVWAPKRSRHFLGQNARMPPLLTNHVNIYHTWWGISRSRSAVGEGTDTGAQSDGTLVAPTPPWVLTDCSLHNTLFEDRRPAP